MLDWLGRAYAKTSHDWRAEGEDRVAEVDRVPELFLSPLRSDGFNHRQRLDFSSQGLFAKNSPQDCFINARTDGPPKEKPIKKVVGFSFG